MLGKTFYMDYNNNGSSKSGNLIKVGTDQHKLVFTHGRMDGGALYISPREQPEEGSLSDEVFFNSSGDIKFGVRYLRDGHRPVEKEGFPTGYFLGEDNLMPEEERKPIVDSVVPVFTAFWERYGGLSSRRKEKIDSLYPLEVGSFFGGRSEGIGAIFREEFWVDSQYSCCGPGMEADIGFQLMAKTDNYDFAFTYQGHFHRTGLLGGLDVSRGNTGFSLLFAEGFDVRGIQEIGAPNTRVGRYFGEEDIKEGEGKKIYTSLMDLFEELRPELQLDRRIEEIAQVSQNDLDLAQRVIEDSVRPLTPFG